MLETLSAEVAGLVQQCDADPSPAFYKQARALLSLAATLNKSLLNISRSEVYLAAWRWLLPACMEAGALAGAAACQPAGRVMYIWAEGAVLSATSDKRLAALPMAPTLLPLVPPSLLQASTAALTSLQRTCGVCGRPLSPVGIHTICECACVRNREPQVEQRAPCV